MCWTPLAAVARAEPSRVRAMEGPGKTGRHGGLMATATASLTTAPTSPGLDALPPSPGTVLGIWAHPDDEAYLSSGLMLRARLSGERVVVVTATDGELGGPSATAAARRRLARRRRRELRSSLEVLGVTEHV